MHRGTDFVGCWQSQALLKSDAGCSSKVVPQPPGRIFNLYRIWQGPQTNTDTYLTCRTHLEHQQTPDRNVWGSSLFRRYGIKCLAQISGILTTGRSEAKEGKEGKMWERVRGSSAEGPPWRQFMQSSWATSTRIGTDGKEGKGGRPWRSGAVFRTESAVDSAGLGWNWPWPWLKLQRYGHGRLITRSGKKGRRAVKMVGAMTSESLAIGVVLTRRGTEEAQNGLKKKEPKDVREKGANRKRRTRTVPTINFCIQMEETAGILCRWSAEKSGRKSTCHLFWSVFEANAVVVVVSSNYFQRDRFSTCYLHFCSAQPSFIFDTPPLQNPSSRRMQR